MAFAVFCLVMGVIGIIVPGLPTTVFILMAGWAAARSSPRLHGWLWNHRLFGPMLQEWANGGRVSRKTKWSATIVMSLCACMLFLLGGTPIWVKMTANGCMACVLVWLWLRPEPPASSSAAAPEH
nr:YbaN family protein [Diaphorobacter caeni]